MRLLLLLLVGAMGTGVTAWGLGRGGRSARLAALAGVAALLALTALALALRPARLTDTGQPITGPFDAHLVPTLYLRLVAGLWGLQSVLLVGIAWLTGGVTRLRALLPATLAAMTGGIAAMASADLAVGSVAAAGTGLATLLVIPRGEGPGSVAAGAREVRVALVAGTVMLAGLAAVPLVARLALMAAGVGSDEDVPLAAGTAGPAMGIIALGLGGAVAARWGVLPFHVRGARLSDLVVPEALPLVLVWVAVPLTVVVFAAVDRLVAPLELPLDGERTLLVMLAAVTLVGAAVAALVHDDVRHATGYLVIADAGLLLLAVAALDPASWGPGRAWLVVLAASKTALGAWAAVMEHRFESRSIPDLRGWARRSPLLATGLVLTVIATFGLPGWIAFDARQDLASAVTGSPGREALLVAGLLTLPAYLRLLWVGIGQVTSRVDRAAPERIARRPRRSDIIPRARVDAEAVTPAARGEGVLAPTRTGGPPLSARHVAGAARLQPGADRIARALRRDRTELLSGAVLALAILAALTSWGALGLAASAAEPAPILLDGNAD